MTSRGNLSNRSLPAVKNLTILLYYDKSVQEKIEHSHTTFVSIPLGNEQ